MIEHVNEIDVAVDEVLRVARKFVLFSTPNHGLTRQLFSCFAKNFVDRTDSKVGHVNIMRFDKLVNRMSRFNWRILTAFTVEVAPPTLDEIKIPWVASPIIRTIEAGTDLLVPSLGSISFVVLARRPA